MTKVLQNIRHRNFKLKLLLLGFVLICGIGEMWGATVTLSSQTNRVNVNGGPSGFRFDLSGDYTINNFFVDYTYTGSGKEAKLSWTVPSGYTISVSQIQINAKNDRIWAVVKYITGKGQYKTSKNLSYQQFCNSHSWETYTLSSSSYFPLGNNGYIQIKAVDRELQYKDIVFTYKLTYSINFDGNGATGGSMSSQTLEYGVAANLKSNQFSKTNYTFVGWNTKADGTGDSYSNNQSVTNLSPGTTLYAQWCSNYTVAFNGNGATSGSMSNQSFVYGTAQKLKTNMFTKTDVVTFDANGGTCGTSSVSKSANFDGWATSSTGAKMYDDEQSVNNLTTTPGATVTLFAHWSQTNTITLPKATKSGYVLAGWSTDGTQANIKGEADQSYFVPLGGTTLTAVWIEKYAPVMTMTGSSTSMEVGEEQSNAFHFEHVDGPVAHITVDSINPINNHDGQVIEYDTANNKIIAHNAGIATIYFTQAETSTIKSGTSAIYTYTVTKRDNTLSPTISTDLLFVEGTANITMGGKIDDVSNPINVAISNQSTPTHPNPSDGTNIITHANNVVTAMNAGTARITVSQAEDYKYKAAKDKVFNITVGKHANSISTKFDNVNATSKTIHLAESTNLSISSTNKNNTDYQVVLTSSNASIVSYTGTGASGTFASNYKEGNTTWSVTQAEDYKYQAGLATMSVNVSALPEVDCSARTYSDVTLTTEISSTSGEQSSAYAVPADYKELCFKVRHNSVTILGIEAEAVSSHMYVEFSKDGGSSWPEEAQITDWSKSWSSEKRFTIPSGVTHFRFNARVGSTLSHYFKDIHITRKTYLQISPYSSANQDRLTPALDFGTTLENNTVTRQFYVEWSSSNTGDIHLSCDNSHFTVSPSIISNTDCASGRTLVTVTYLADEHPTTTDITHSGTITIYDKGRTTTPVNVTGTTQPQYNLVVSGQNKSIQVEDDLNLSDIITYSYEGNSVVPAVPTYGENTSPFYFTIGIDNITSNQNDCAVPNAVVMYDPGTKKFHACNAGKVTITFTQVEDNGTPAVHAGMKVGGVHCDNVSYTITVTKHDPTFTWTLPNAEWASKYKFSYYFSSSNTATSWSAVSNTDIAVYRSSTDSIYTNYRSGDATFTITQEENYYWKRYSQDVTTTVAHGEEAECYLYESDSEVDIAAWDFVQATWQDTAVAGKVIFDLMRGPWDLTGTISLRVHEYVNGVQSQVGEGINNQDGDSWTHCERNLNPQAMGVSFDNYSTILNKVMPKVVGDKADYTNHVKNVKVTRLSWVKASSKNVTLPTIGKLGYSEATVVVTWSGVDSLRIEKKNNNSHFSVSPDEHFVQTFCSKTGSSVLTFTYHSDTPVANETETFVIYDHARSVEIVVHGTTENKDMQEIVWDQSFNPVLAPNGTIDMDTQLTAYATDRQGIPTNSQITYLVANTAIATIENNNHLHITGMGRTTITATAAGSATYSSATKTIVLNVLDGNGCGSYAYSNSDEVDLFTITSNEAMAVTRPAEDLYFEAKRDFASIQKYVKLRYKVAGDDDWKYNDENGVELKADELPWRDYQLYGPYRLPENTVGIQFYTELGATLSKHVRNVYITQRSYLRKDKDELSATILVNNSTKIGEFIVEYSDKPTLIINNKCGNVKLGVDDPAANACGDAGKYTYTVTCLSDTIGVIKDTVTITSHLEGDTLLIPITITVGVDGNFIFDNGFDHDTTHTDWNVSQYWRKDNVYNHNSIPTMASLTTIEGPTIIDYDAYTYQLTITNTGSVTIAPSGSLKVGAGGIIGANVSNLVLEADTTGKTGVLRLYPGIPDEKLPDALVQIYAKAFWDRENKQKAVWQYIGTPVRNPDTNEHIFYQCWLYQYNQSLDKWKNAGNWGHMNPFQAYALTRDSKSSGPLTGFGGKLNTLSTQNVDLTYIDKDHCENHLANSWTAPIYLKQFKPSDFQNVDPIIYCYTIEGKGLAKEIAVYTSDYTGNDILPAMQGFFVKAKTNENPQLLLDYERLVWKNETSKNAPLRAPSRMNEEESDLSARICIQMTSADMVTDRIYLLEKDDEGFSPDYEVGYDAPKYFVDGLPCIYTYETSGPHLAVSATDDVVGTYLAINTNASQNYTLTFSKVIGEGLGLRDLVTNTIVPISEGMQYAFTAPANSSPMLRFVVVEHEETPQWNNNNGTSLEDLGGEFKIWQSGEILSVIGAGSHASLRLYDAAGKLILSEFFNEATAINLNALPTGVYMVQVNDKTEKVLR